MRILLVEDDLITQKAAALIIESCGAEVTVVGTAHEALAVLNNHYDVAFLDLGLPDLDGLQLAAKIRQLKPQIKLVLLTAHDSYEIADHPHRNEIDMFLRKPLTRASCLDAFALVA